MKGFVIRPVSGPETTRSPHGLSRRLDERTDYADEEVEEVARGLASPPAAPGRYGVVSGLGGGEIPG